MVAQLLRLRLRLFANSLKRSGWQAVGLVVGLGYGLGLGAVAVIGLIGLRLVDPDLAGSIVTVFGAILVLGYLVVPLAFGVDDAMDPRKLSLFGIPTGRLAGGLALAALLSVPSLVIVLIAAAQVVTWSRGGLPLWLAALGAVLLVASCVLGARVTTSVAAYLLASRRARDVTGTVALLVLLGLAPVAVLLSRVDWGRDGIALLDGVVGFVGWTPFGAAWAAPADAAAGRNQEAIAKVVIAAGFVVFLWLVWRILVGHMLVTPQREMAAKTYNGLGWFGVIPATSTGAVTARTLTYWARDSRYQVSLLVIPIIPFIMLVPLLVAGVPAFYLALVPVPVIALFLGWSIHNDVAYDNTAIWLHVVSDIRGKADRFGRAVPALLVGVPLLLVGSIVSANLFGSMEVLPSLIGVSLCILFCGLGLSSVVSARFPYPVVRPGDSPFAQPQSVGTASSLIQSVSFLATLLLSLPTIGLAVLGLMGADGNWEGVALIFGLLTGLAVLVLGVNGGGRIFEKRGTDLLAFSMRN